MQRSLLKRLSWSGRRLRLSVLGALLVVVFLTFVGPISFSRNDDPPAVLPDTKEQFSLDLSVVGSVNHDVVYAVAQRARPKYRIFAFDPSTGKDTTVFTVPTDAIVYGIALNPDRSKLAVSYSPDFHINGSGLSLLDLTTNALTGITSATTGIFHVDLEWSPDGTAVYSTHVDQRATTEQLLIARTNVDTGSVESVVANAVDPAFVGDDLYYLEVDESRARRSIRRLGESDSISIVDGAVDLDHLLGGTRRAELRVGVLKADSSITVGTPARADGNHDVASSWWQVATAATTKATPLGIDPTIVYDAATRNDSIVYATQEGLSIAIGARKTNVIASRAIRLVAA